MANSRYLQNIKFILQTPVAKQVIFIIGIAGGVTLGMSLYMNIKEPIYRPLDYRVNSQNMATIADTLDKAGIEYKLNAQDGMILVSANDVQLARLRLSAAGVQKDDGFNFSYLNDQNGIGHSQFLENARYVRALESDLAKTISAIEGITSARVHIAIPESNVFADENHHPTASIVISGVPGLTSDKDKVRSVVQIVASSVPGLDPKNVSITDQYGHFLSGAFDQDAIYNAEQMNYQNKIQSYYESRIESMIIPILGDEKVSVRVYANIDFTQQEEAKESFDPSQHVIRSEQTSTEQSQSGGASGVPGALSNTPPSEEGDKKAAPTGGGNERTSSTKNYEVGKLVSYKKSYYPKIVNLSVAVVVDNKEMNLDEETKKVVSKPLDKDKLNKITELVKATIGYDEKRGDKVTVVNSSFNVIQTGEKVVAQRFWELPWVWDLGKKILGGFLGFIFLIVIYRRLSNFLKSIHSNNETSVVATTGNDSQGEFYVTPEMHELKQEQIQRLKELATKDPNRVSTVIKNWIAK